MCMTAIKGRKQLTYAQRQQLFRNTPRAINSYSNATIDGHRSVLENFERDDYELYEKLMHRFKRVDQMLRWCVINNTQGAVLELATIRSEDLKLHQKLLQVLRYQWTDIWDVKNEAINQDPDKFWFRMASTIQRRAKTESYGLAPEWEGIDGRLRLIDYLKELYEKQEGMCAMSKQPMLLIVGDKKTIKDKCSPDRKNSKKGYTPDNLWLVTWWINEMKKDDSLITFWKKINILAEARGLVSKQMVS